MPTVTLSRISPSRGPPGTRIVLRGDHFGENASNIKSISICGTDCTHTLEMISERQVSCYVLAEPVKKSNQGEIVITDLDDNQIVTTMKFELTAENVTLNEMCYYWCAEEYSVLLPEDESRKMNLKKKEEIEPDPMGVSKTISQLPDLFKSTFSKASIQLNNENFDPVMFLLQRHVNTDWSSLKEGFERLVNNEKMLTSHWDGKESQQNRFMNIKGKRQSQHNELFLKDVQTMVDAIQSLDHLNVLITEGHKTRLIQENNLREHMNEISPAFNKLFSRTSDSYEKNKILRSKLETVSRYRYLFSLGKSIDKSISRGDYEMLVSDYMRTQNLLGQFGSKHLQSFIDSIRSSIEPFVIHLKNQLVNSFPCDFKSKNMLLKYLRILAPEEDHELEFIVSHAGWLLNHTSEQYNRLTTELMTLATSKRKLNTGTRKFDDECLVIQMHRMILRVLKYVEENSSVIYQEIEKLLNEFIAYQDGKPVTKINGQGESNGSKYSSKPLLIAIDDSKSVLEIFGETLKKILTKKISTETENGTCFQDSDKTAEYSLSFFEFSVIESFCKEDLLKLAQCLVNLEVKMYTIIAEFQYLESAAMKKLAGIDLNLLPESVTQANKGLISIVYSRYIVGFVRDISCEFKERTDDSFYVSKCAKKHDHKSIQGDDQIKFNHSKAATTFPFYFSVSFVQMVENLSNFLIPFKRTQLEYCKSFNSTSNIFELEDKHSESSPTKHKKIKDIFDALLTNYQSAVDQVASDIDSVSLEVFSILWEEQVENVLFSLYRDLFYCKEQMFPDFRQKLKMFLLFEMTNMVNLIDSATYEIGNIIAKIIFLIREVKVRRVMYQSECLLNSSVDDAKDSQSDVNNQQVRVGIHVSSVLSCLLNTKRKLEYIMSNSDEILISICSELLEWLYKRVMKQNCQNTLNFQLTLNIYALYTSLSQKVPKSIHETYKTLEKVLLDDKRYSEFAGKAITEFGNSNQLFVKCLTPKTKTN